MKTIIFKAALMLAMFISFSGCSSDDSDPPMICPDGYQGPNCDVKITPSKIYITKIVVRSFPFLTSDFEFWDNGEDTSNEYPDVLAALGYSPNTILMRSDYIVDANENSGYLTYTPTPHLEIPNIYYTYTLGLFDYDGGDSYQFMAESDFYAYKDSTVGFPEFITVQNTSQYLVADVYLSYEW